VSRKKKNPPSKNDQKKREEKAAIAREIREWFVAIGTLIGAIAGLIAILK
jgi:hypothetical protein